MSNTPPSLPTPPKINAQPLPWVNRPKFYAKDDTAVQLVALFEVVRWLTRSKELPFYKAAKELHDALKNRLETLVLYFFDEDAKTMQAVGLSDVFGLLNVGGRRFLSPGIRIGEDGPYRPALPQRSQPTLPVEVTPGPSAALYCLERDWCRFGTAESAIDTPSSWHGKYGKYLAVTCDLAVEIWAADVAKLHAVPEQLGSVAEEWTGERLAAQQALFKAGGHKDFAKRTWELAGIKERDSRRLVSEYYEATKKANASASKAVVSTVFSMGKAVAKKTKKRA